MASRFLKLIKRYFSFKADSKKLVIQLFITSMFARVSLLPLPFIAAKIIDYITLNNYKFAFLSVLAFAISAFIAVIARKLNYKAYKNHAIYTHNNLQDMIARKVSTFDEDYSKKLSKSFLVNTAYQDVGQVMQIPDKLFDSINYLINITISIFILIKVNYIIGLIMLGIIIFSLIYVLYNLQYREHYLGYQRKYQDKISSLLGEVIDGGSEIQAFNMEEDINKYLDRYNRMWKRNYFKKRKYQDRVYVIGDTFIEFFKVAIYVIFALAILKGHYSISALIMVVGYVEDSEDYFWKMKENLIAISGMSTRINRIHIILNYNHKNMDLYGDISNDDISGLVEFNKVSMKYENKLSLDKVSFELLPNTLTAIVGKSGSGKSTIFRALLRLYKISDGEILIDGVNIYDYSKNVYSSNVSIVTQKPFIFDMSIRENLNLVDSNFKHQVEACKRVGIHDYISSLPNGYNTKLYANGDNFSGGQKQLLALARTLLSKSEILLFDEVTSTLDLNTSNQIMKILKSLKRNHTILMITHKPELMKEADNILVINNGKLVGNGNHKELIKTNKYYKELQK